MSKNNQQFLQMELEKDKTKFPFFVFYLVHDEPLLHYLGVKASTKRFKPTLYTSEETLEELRKIKEALTIDIKALLYSSKDGLTERELKKEYRELTGIDIPFARIGYRSLYDLMKRINDFILIKSYN
jgi:hypothetical protein